jgi:uncharacterized membrane protein
VSPLEIAIIVVVAGAIAAWAVGCEYAVVVLEVLAALLVVLYLMRTLQ